MALVTDDIPLVDQHCHGVLTKALGAAELSSYLTEAPEVPHHRDPFNSLLGLGVRRWCAPILDLPSLAGRDVYLRRRVELGWREVTERLLRAANVTEWLVDTGFTPPQPLTGPEVFSGGAGREVVRIEHVAETLAAQGKFSLNGFRATLHERAANAVGLKTIVGYRSGLAVPSLPPTSTAARVAAERWLRRGGRVEEPDLLSWLVHEGARVAAELSLPLQVHAGFGDPDLRLRDVDPALLHDFVEAYPNVMIVLLHCWPYHRNAAYLAHVFPNVVVDVGLMVPFVGARAGDVLGEVLELAPFDAVVWSSDGRQLPETHYLAAALWRHHFGRLLDTWINEDVLTVADAERLAFAVGSGNAGRIYRLGGGRDE
jgi:hypothetical protein